MKTAVQQLIEKLEYIKKHECKTLQEIIFFDGVLAITDAFLEVEKQQIIEAYEKGFEDVDAERYYNETFEKPCQHSETKYK